jgi:hypothetical protein
MERFTIGQKIFLFYLATFFFDMYAYLLGNAILYI